MSEHKPIRMLFKAALVMLDGIGDYIECVRCGTAVMVIGLILLVRGFVAG